MYRMIPLPYYVNKVEKSDVLKVIRHYYSYLPKQGSDEWKTQRSTGNITDCLVAGKDWLPKLTLTVSDKKVISNPYSWTITQLMNAYTKKYLPRSITVGGSEITGLVKASTYRPIWQVAMEKLHGKNGFDGNTDTRWGTLFENVISRVMQWNLHAKAIELGAIPGDRLSDGSVYQKFSPDNLMLCKLSKYRMVFANVSAFPTATQWIQQIEETAPDPYIIVILEYKCPTKREPALFIPENYTWQPRTGTVITPCVDVGLFVDSSFRKCSLADFDLSLKYCIQYFEKDFTFKEPFTTPDCIGFIGFECAIDCALKLVENNVSLDPERVKLLASYVNYDLQFCTEISDIKIVAIACRLVKRLPLATDTCKVVIELCKTLTSLNIEEIKNQVYSRLPLHAAIENLLDWGAAEPSTLTAVLAEATKRNGTRQLHPYYPNGAYKAKNSWEAKLSHWQDYSITNSAARATDWLLRNMVCWVNRCKRRGMRPVGVMCWKLMRCKIVPVIPNYPDTYGMFEKAKYAVNLLNSVRTLSQDEQLQKLQNDPKLGSPPRAKSEAQKVTIAYGDFAIDI